ncbi:MAG: crossover junction endodeoxyribonuclease RuvC, partial [Oscillospiraceae bacterium]|nr:crossover junction endodeoxyribonuclease RuvC [Oscillospiraceae bacterium]
MFIALEGAEFVIIMGVDPGIATVGFGFLSVDKQRQAVLQYGTVTTPAELPLSTRLLQIAEDLETLIAQFHPDEMAVEELFFNTNVKTGISVAHGRGVILLTAEKCGLPIYEYTPLQVKQAV